ncbi:hypothetical protein FNV43_RR13995 [Rhamnella rubrinervis]|uniref:Protein PLASTID MOVEMENT IMPAIRED 2 n=1 Tax=Rhamnella rubrinervis TaxID=2594499 RepID=A0A8K0MFW3_9ROSA|nr:hypothetical protein FNV43_RR13995 [Rhamnella rubrinervis]
MERRGISGFKETRKARGSLRTQTESKLSNAEKTMKDLSPLQLRASKAKAKAQIQEIETPKKSRPSEEQIVSDEDMDDYQYTKVMRELEVVKQELGLLKLDMAAVLVEKLKAEKPIKKENENEIEEQKPLQLARIETLKDQTDNVEEDEREEKARQISSKIEQTKKKLKDILVDLEHTRELEFDTKSNSLEGMDANFQRQEDLERELEAAEKELAFVKEEGFQYLTSMDIIRNELKHVMAETSKLKKIEEKSDSTVENLNSKLLQAKAKLEVVSLTAEKAKSVKTNLSLILEHLKAEAEKAKKEKELLVKESVNMEAEIQNAEFETRYVEGRLQAAMEELEVVKSSEALAMGYLTENTMKTRAYEPQNGSSITISKFEYEYLKGCSTGAEEIANKKVAASQAWIEAIKATEKDILIKIDLAQREIREKRLEEEREAYRTKRSSSGKRMIIDGDQVQSRRQKWEKNATTLPRKPKKRNENLTPTTWKGNGNDNLTPSNKLSLAYENQA